MRVRYTGGLDSVRVPLPNGRVLVADRLEPVDFRDDATPQLESMGARERDALAKALLESEEWEQVHETAAAKASGDKDQGGES
jgi:hypothetical protein